ncbi:hypothetical protein N9J94_06765, partial [Planktomarina sp.]
WFTGGKTDLYALSFSKGAEIDPKVARILKEEAEREMAAREIDSERELTKKLGHSTETKDQVITKVATQSDQDGHVSLTWRQRVLILLFGLLCALTALYIYAPNAAKMFPSVADWIFSYVFLVNDGRQFLYEIMQSWDQFLVSLDIAGTAANAKDWVVGTVQAIIEFGLSLVGGQETNADE